jgi:hypothetical protein
MLPGSGWNRNESIIDVAVAAMQNPIATIKFCAVGEGFIPMASR